jgi:hypothetical protein
MNNGRRSSETSVKFIRVVELPSPQQRFQVQCFYDQPLLLYYTFRSHKDHHQVVLREYSSRREVKVDHKNIGPGIFVVVTVITLTYWNTQQDEHREDSW